MNKKAFILILAFIANISMLVTTQTILQRNLECRKFVENDYLRSKKHMKQMILITLFFLFAQSVTGQKQQTLHDSMTVFLTRLKRLQRRTISFGTKICMEQYFWLNRRPDRFLPTNPAQATS
jgi:Ni,Fe-hydrogenase I cytochrome b subunit